MEKLREIIKDAYIGLVGNRVTLAGRFAIGAALAIGLSQHIHDPNTYSSINPRINAFYNPISMDIRPGHNFGKDMALALLTFSGFATELITLSGLGTVRYYRRTKEHIKKHGMLDERFAGTVFSESEKGGEYVGYCQNQGIYLAAKENNQLDTFKRIKQECSINRIPNF